jgi:hypothetical protein
MTEHQVCCGAVMHFDRSRKKNPFLLHTSAAPFNFYSKIQKTNLVAQSCSLAAVARDRTHRNRSRQVPVPTVGAGNFLNER